MFSFLVYPLFVFVLFFVVAVRICLSFFTYSFLNNKMSYFREPGVLLVESPLIEGILLAG